MSEVDLLFEKKKYNAELKPLSLYKCSDKDMNSNQQKFFEIKKTILLSNHYDQVQNIKDEYILDGFIENNKNELNWDDFLTCLLLNYKNNKLKTSIISKLKFYGSITYSQVFQMKIYYDKEFTKLITKHVIFFFDYLISPALFYSCYVENVNTSLEILKAINKYENIPREEMYNILRVNCGLPIEEAREYCLR